ncbi:hypothetical protein F5141DRAFT_1220442 [Pisolithus sp. B1]|nr:hypothetical protein F5141DRAFT_1220442 [Pisolithus sp. B1]
MPEESSDGDEGGKHKDDDEGSGQGNDNEQHTGDRRSDGQAQNGDSNNSSLPPSLLPPHLPSDSSDTKDDLLSLCQPTWTSNKGKGGNNEAPPSKSKKPGMMSHAALDDMHEFTSKVKKEAEELGRCHSRSTRDILVTARFGVKPSHMKLNEANLFHLWYWATQPKPDGAKRDAINDIIMKEYNSLIKDIPKDDTAVRRDKLKFIYKWSENSSAVPTNKSVKSITARVQNVKMQFSGLAKAWSNLEEMEIVGVVMYVGQDPAGCQTSSIFGGSDMVRNFINQCTVNAHALMDKYTSIFKYLRDGSGPETGLPSTSSARGTDSSWELHCCIQEIPRDQNHRVFGSMMKEKLVAALKDLHDVINMSESSHLKGEIPLIKAADGTVLHKVSDDPSWQKSHGEDSRQENQVDPPQQHQLPFPSHKRPCVEVSNDDMMAVHTEDQACLIATPGMLTLFREAAETKAAREREI